MLKLVNVMSSENTESNVTYEKNQMSAPPALRLSQSLRSLIERDRKEGNFRHKT